MVVGELCGELKICEVVSYWVDEVDECGVFFGEWEFDDFVVVVEECLEECGVIFFFCG